MVERRRTKLVVRNLPGSLTREQFVDALKRAGFRKDEHYAYVDYVPGRGFDLPQRTTTMKTTTTNDDKEDDKDEDDEDEDEKRRQNGSRKGSEGNGKTTSRKIKINEHALTFVDLAAGGWEAVEKFAETFDGAPFQVMEEFSRAKVEFALNQRVPLGVQRKSSDK